MFLNHSEQRLGRKNPVSLNKKNYLNTELVEGRDGVRVSMLKNPDNEGTRSDL